MQAMAYLGKADELLRWSSELRGLQLPQLPTSLIYPWQPVSKGSQAAQAGSAQPQNSHAEGELSAGQQCSPTASAARTGESSSETMSASCSDGRRNSASGAHFASGSSAPQEQGETVSSNNSEATSNAQRHKTAETAKKGDPDSHAHHIWSSWLRWQDR